MDRPAAIDIEGVRWIQKFDDSPKRQLETTVYSRREATVSPDGKWIAFVADPMLRPDSVVDAERDSLARLRYDAKRDEAARNDADVFVVSVTVGPARQLTTRRGIEHDLAW